MEKSITDSFISLPTETPIWNRFFTIAPLIVIGTKEGNGYDLAPKHMATPLGRGNYFGFVCTPEHSTYHNIKATSEFTVSFPLADQPLLAALSASPRCGDPTGSKDIVQSLPTLKATTVDSLFIKDSYLYLECELFKILDGFLNDSFITGKVKAAFVHKDYIRVSENDEQQQLFSNPLLAYVAHGRFAKISETYNFPFPKNFKR